MDMKRLLICIYALLAVTIVMADNVTPEEALQQATQFVKERIATGQHARRSPGSATPQLTLAKKVSGLYVFNVDNSCGFVIVSNDDRTEAVLGYSDKGSFDPNNIPDNMRAWLQGYADEIAWLNEHPRPAAIKAPRRTSDATIKTPIAPLVQTTWDQGEPYNNLCPYYYEDDYGNISYSVEQVNDDYEHCATGCVATAMAQVMKYHKWPEQATKNIPSYSWQGNDMTELAPVAFDWNNMILDYSGNYTNTQATAIATLMKHCGYSLEMDYGPESGSNTDMVANALKTYFDYNSNTVKCVSRSDYSYENWIEIIYYELANGRPITYGGLSSGGGHEFVCDGYQGEDYFHINWGWSGTSDGYFKLSSLNPYDQGIGGSSSTDGFHFGQDAVIGIQKSIESGTTLEMATNNYSLSLSNYNSVSFSQSPIQFHEMNITLNVRNSGTNDYDGDIGVEVQYLYGGSWYLVGNVAKVFVIPAKETKECTLNYIPEYAGSYRVRAFRGGYYLNNNYYNFTVGEGEVTSTSDNITLEPTITVQNSETVGNQNYVYGNTINATVTVTNPETDTNYYGGFHYRLYEYDGNWNVLDQNAFYIIVPAGGTYDIPIQFSGITSGKSYEIDVRYVKNGSWSNWTDGFLYRARPGIVSYDADGTQTVTKPTSTSYSAGSGVLAVDLTGTDVSSVTSSEPNCLFIIGSGDSAPSGANNIIVKNSNSYSATNITLTDNKDFYSPVDFTADNVEFNYNFTKAADGTNGWNTLMLPFNVTKVTATDPTTNETKEIDWFHNADNTGKNFWVKEFSSDANNTVNFDFADEMKANTPYIVAFPGNKWGPKWDMSNKVLKFIGENVTVSKGGTVSSVTGSSYRFIGNTVQDDTENIYTMNADGNKFVQNENSGSAPFRAYFKPGIYDRTVTSLAIGSEPGGTTGIEDVNLNDNLNVNGNGNFFNLNGQRVTHPTKGLYINNGKKIIIK